MLPARSTASEPCAPGCDWRNSVLHVAWGQVHWLLLAMKLTQRGEIWSGGFGRRTELELLPCPCFTLSPIGFAFAGLAVSRRPGSFIDSDEGWWPSSQRIVSVEVDSEMTGLREQFCENAFPIDEGLLAFDFDETTAVVHQASTFVQQLDSSRPERAESWLYSRLLSCVRAALSLDLEQTRASGIERMRCKRTYAGW